MKQTSLLQIDDLEIGMFFTIHTGPIFEQTTANSSSFLDPKTKTRIREDDSYKGDILQLIAANLPYIVAKEYTYVNVLDGRITTDLIKLDIRKIKLMKLTNNYVQALCPGLIEQIEKEKIDE